MQSNPTLLVVAGCNGSGKSTFSKILIDTTVIPFDYDKRFLEIYNNLLDFDLKDVMSHNKTRGVLEVAIKESIDNKLDFCYETNFNSTPMHWVELFRKEGYQISMMFFCLNTTDEAKRRVKIRFESGGHFVPDREVEERFRFGYENLDLNFNDFDCVELFDSSGYNVTPTHVLSLSKGEITAISKYPKFLESLLPNLTTLVNQYIELRQ